MRFLFQVIFSEIWKEILKPIFRFIITRGNQDLWETCKLAVAGVEADFPDLTGREKFQIVFQRVTETMLAKGKEYRTSVKNLFIELAVSYLKNKLGL